MTNPKYEVSGTYEIPYQFTDLVLRRTTALLTAGNAQTMTLAGLLQSDIRRPTASRRHVSRAWPYGVPSGKR